MPPMTIAAALSRQIDLARYEALVRGVAKPRVVTHITTRMFVQLREELFLMPHVQGEPCTDTTPTFGGSALMRVNGPGLWMVSRAV